MTEGGGATTRPDLMEVVPSGRGPSKWVAVGLVTAAAVVLIGIAVAGQSSGPPSRQPAMVVASATPAAAPAGTPAVAPSATVLPTPPLGTPPARIAVAVGPAPTCPPGSTPDQPGPADQARPPSGSMAFDRAAGKIVLVADGADGADGAQTWTLDVCANTWTLMHPIQEPRQVSGSLVYDVDSGVTVALDGVRAWAYDLETDTWTAKGPTPSPDLGLRFYDPVTGHVVALGGNDDAQGGELWSYEVETDTWSSILQANRLPGAPREYAYDASVDRLVAYSDIGDGFGAARTWLLDLGTGTWSATRAITPVYAYGWWGIQPSVAYDEAAARTVMAGQGRADAYDAATDRWEPLFTTPPEDQPPGCGTRPECRMGLQLVYDPVNERLVGYGGTAYAACTWEAVDDVWAFDVAARSWSLLVPPTPAPPRLLDLGADEEQASASSDRSPWIRAAKATLHGGPFFTRVVTPAEEPWPSTPQAAAASVVDGRFLPECQGWTDGTVWWEEIASDPSSRAWIEIDLGGTFALDAAVVQADVNDDYRLSYRDPKTSAWKLLWAIPPGQAGGMATRPQQGNASVRWPVAPPVVTDALRFEAVGGDAQYSVSEIAVFGRPAP